jgi:HK97 family phage prohead protease
MSKNNTTREVRSFTAARPFTVRTTADGSKQISGYALIWNSPSVDLGGFTEICDPGMLTRTLRESPDVLMLRDHKQELLLGRTTAGTLQLNVDSTGLAFTVTLPQTAIGEDTYENVKLGNLSGCSFGFTTVQDDFSIDNDGNVVRTLLDVDLFEISITSFPAYQDTSVSARSRAQELRTALAQRDDDDLDDCDPTIDADCNDLDDSDDDDDDETNSVRCSCRCERCVMSDCTNCYRSSCTDRACRDAGCMMPAQDEDRADALRVTQLFNSRHKILTS